MDKTTQELRQLLQDPRVDRRADPQVYIVKEDVAPDVYEAIVSDDYILEKGYHYKLIAEDGTQTVALGDGESNFTEASISGGGSEPTTVAWSEVTDKPTTFPPTIGTTATTAKAGNYVPAWGDITAKPSTFTPTIGTTATTALAGNYVPPVATASTNGTVKLASSAVQTIAATAPSATASRTYMIQLNSNGQMVVNVPWTAYTLPNATTAVKGGVNMATAQVDSTATDVETLLTDFNSLLAKLRTAGLLAT